MNAPKLQNLTPEEVKVGLDRGELLLVDVREPHETAQERIAGGVEMPFRSFDPDDLPDPAGKRVVFYCRSGQRSAHAALRSQAAGLPYDAHLAGGILAWKAAGFDTE